MRDRERDFGQRREEATIGGGGCGEPALPIWFRPKSKKVKVWVWRNMANRLVHPLTQSLVPLVLYILVYQKH